MAGTFFPDLLGKRLFSSKTGQPKDAKSAARQNLDLTIGVEFEFVIVRYAFPEAIGPMGVSRKPNTITYGADQGRAVLSRPLQARCDVCHKYHMFSLPINQGGSNFAKWTVEMDTSIELTENERSFIPPQERPNCQEYPVELKSRILQTGQRLQTSQSKGLEPHMHEITYQEEIRVVLEALRVAFSPPEGDDSGIHCEHLVVNNSCGLHVHVGNQDLGFPIETVKNVLTTYTACERVIDELHAADRISDTSILRTPWEEIESNPPLPASYEANAWWDFYLADAFQPEPVYNRSLRGIAILDAMKLSLNTAEEIWYAPNRYPLAYRAGDAPVPQAATEFHCASFIDLIARAPSIASLQTLLARIESFAPGDPLKDLCRRVLQRRAYNSYREAVDQAIFNKVCHGGYGQIHPHELHDLAELYQYDIDELLAGELAIGGKGKECFRVGP